MIAPALEEEPWKIEGVNRINLNPRKFDDIIARQNKATPNHAYRKSLI